MAIRGKRLIFCDDCTLPAQEGKALQADILPGMAVVQAATGFNKGVSLTPLVADYDMLQAGTVDDAWPQNDNMIARQVESGKRANVLVADGNNITTVGTGLSANADGTWSIDAATPTVVSDEIINVAGADALVRVRGI